MFSPKKIMHVDDDTVVRQITNAALNAAGYEVFSCEEGREAIEGVKEFEPDLILLDFVMPEIGGPRTASILKGLGNKIPVIFLTGKNTIDLMDEYRHRYVIGCIHKPYEPTELADMIKNICEKSGL